MGTWQCGYCGSFNPDTVDQCITCGRDRRDPIEGVDGRPKEQTKTCPECGGSNPLGRATCQWCGAELSMSPMELQWDRQPVQAPEPEPEGFELDSGLLDEAEPTIQTVPEGHKSKLRPCHSCGTLVSPDEWVVVAGPRLLCRACYYEEFGSRRKRTTAERTSGVPAAEASDEAGVEAGQVPSVRRKRLAVAYAVSSGVCLALGAGVTAAFGFTWGFTPLAAGVTLAVLFVVELGKFKPQTSVGPGRVGKH